MGMREAAKAAEHCRRGVGDLTRWSAMIWGGHWRQRIGVEVARGLARCIERAATACGHPWTGRGQLGAEPFSRVGLELLLIPPANRVSGGCCSGVCIIRYSIDSQWDHGKGKEKRGLTCIGCLELPLFSWRHSLLWGINQSCF